jgi:hypothetical protein
MLAHVHDDIEVAGRSAGGAGFAFADETQLLAGRDPGGNLDGDLPLARDPSRAAAFGARLRDDLAGAAALRAGTGNGEKALLIADLSLAFALRTAGCCRPGRGAGSAAFLEGIRARTRD